MANPGYTRSTDGSDPDTGATWALSNATLTGAIADMVAGDRNWSSHVHSETTAGALTLTFPGTAASPNEILCGNDGAEPPTALANTAVVATTGANNITLNGSFYLQGHEFRAGDGSNSSSITCFTTTAGRQVYDDCLFNLNSTNTTNRITLGNISGSDSISVEWLNTDVQFSNVSQSINLRGLDFIWYGGAVVADAAITSLFADIGGAAARAGGYLVAGVDFSNIATGCNILATSASVPSGSFRFVLTGCILPASWSGAPTSGALTDPGQRIELRKYMVGTTKQLLWIRDHFGDIVGETTIVRSTGGAVDGSTSYSLKMDTTQSNGANCQWPWGHLISDWIPVWVSTTGSKTFTVEILVDTAAFPTWNNNDITLGILYPSAASSYLLAAARGGPADILASSSALAAGVGTGSWVTTGLTTPSSKRVTLVATVNEVGQAYIRVRMFLPSAVAYVDPKVTVTSNP